MREADRRRAAGHTDSSASPNRSSPSSSSDAPYGSTRRRFLATVGASALAGLAGCSSLNLTNEDTQKGGSRTSTPLSDRPAAVYYPTHATGMQMSGMQQANGYACALTYTIPEAFWLVTGDETPEATPTAGDEIHVMPVVWDTETGQRLTDLSPMLRFADDGAVVTSNAPWPMLAQRMGFHFGDNVTLPGGGTYDVSVRVGAPAVRRTGGVATPDSATFDFSLAYSAAELNAIAYRTIDRAGERGALEPMSMEMLPTSALPAADALPGRPLGTGTIGDAAVVATVLDDATRYGGSEGDTYLAVSPRTPYNHYPLPMAGFSARVDGTDYALTETIDADLGHHYGVTISGDVTGATVSLALPPQVSRHEGYETAFFETASVALGE